ncbi:MAG: 30S ribosome-binding factor RbfA [Microthrixaceae bacterium]
MSARRRPSAPRQYSRTDRVSELVREIVASELERIGDERLEMVTITAVDVDGALEHADVFYSALGADEDGRDEEVAEALEERRWKVQQVVNRDVRARRTPQIRFRKDTVLSSALRIDQILREIGEREGDSDSDSDTETDTVVDDADGASDDAGTIGDEHDSGDGGGADRRG